VKFLTEYTLILKEKELHQQNVKKYHFHSEFE